MEVTHSEDQQGIVTRHIIETNLRVLRELEKSYKSQGFRTDLYIYDSCQGKWCLNVRVPFLGKERAA